MASSQRVQTPPAEVFDKDTVALHLRGLAHQVSLFETQSLNQATLEQILAEVRATSARMDGMETRMDGMEARMGGMETRLINRIDGLNTSITQRIDTMQEGMNKRFDKLESFAKNTNARAKNARARELGVSYTPLVKEDGSAIRNFPRTFDVVNTLNDTRLSTLLPAVGVEPEKDWTVAQKRSAFLGAIGVMQSPNL